MKFLFLLRTCSSKQIVKHMIVPAMVIMVLTFFWIEEFHGINSMSLVDKFTVLSHSKPDTLGTSSNSPVYFREVSAS